MQPQKKKSIKLTIEGETKRLKLAPTFQSLVAQATEKFPDQGLEATKSLRFYYLDDDQEIISISSQHDYLEALEIEDVTTLKLIVAKSTQEARQVLERQMSESVSLANSINMGQQAFNATAGSRASNIFSRADTESDFLQEPLFAKAQEMPAPEQQKPEKSKDEIVNMITDMKTMFQNAMSALVPQNATADVAKAMTACESKLRSELSSFKMPEMPEMPELPQMPQMPEMPSIPTIIDTMTPRVLATEKIEESKTQDKPVESRMDCFKCKGEKCSDCDGRGFFNITGLEHQIEVIKEEIQQLSAAGLKDVLLKHKRSHKQEEQVHEGYICDGCDAEIVGIRYKCTQQDDYDLCEKCEAKGINDHHVMLKIRKTHHAPAKLICKYGSQSFIPPFVKQACGVDADGYLDKVVDMNAMAETFKSFCTNFQQAQQPKPEQPTAAPQSDLKMPEVPESLPKDDETKASTIMTTAMTVESEDEYVLEDVSIVEDLTKDDQPATDLQKPVVEEMKTWTPKPCVEQPISKEECYKLEAAAESDNLRATLMQLLDFGFTDFARNKELLIKFNMNVDAVASALLEDAELYE